MSPAFAPLSSKQRAEYLKSMGITQWVPKQSLALAKEPFDEQVDRLDQVPEKTEHSDRAISKMDKQKNTEIKQDKPLIENGNTDNEQITQVQTNEWGGFIKQVKSPLILESKNKLLVLCRHHKDQPAQSFANPHGLSLFMQDYIKSLSYTLQKQAIEAELSLGHLTEAGLGSEHIPFRQHIDQLKPKLTLIMGEEAVKQLIGTNYSVATLRGKKHQILNELDIIATYHPYELITQPALKRLAFEDIHFIASFLKHNLAS